MKSVKIHCFIITLATFASVSIGQALEDDLSFALSKLDKGIRELEQHAPQSSATLDEASALLETVIEKHQIKTPGVYHALGNAYMLNNHIGQAILSYRQGEQFDPTNLELRESLAHARSQVPIQIGSGTQTRIWSVLLYWRGYISRSTLWIAFLLLSTLGWVGCSASLLSFGSHTIRTVSIWLILGSLIPFAMLGMEQLRYQNSTEIVITSKNVIARSGPDDAIYDPVFSDTLQPGVEARIIESRDDWFQIELADSSQCWVSKKSVQRVNP